MEKEGKEEITHVSFSLDKTHLTCASTGGIQVYKCQPLESTCQTRLKTGIAIAELQDINNIWYVRGGEYPITDLQYVCLWNRATYEHKAIHSMNSPVKSVKVCRGYIAVVLENYVKLYQGGFKIYKDHATMSNPTGVCALAEGYVLATLGLREGEVFIYNVKNNPKMAHPVYIQAHQAPISCLVLSDDGNFLATSSAKGTLIRIFKTQSWEKVQELRRGKDTATITSLAFSANNRWLVVSSDKHTIHVFSLDIVQPASTSLSSSSSSCEMVPVSNNISSLSFFRGVLPSYFSSEWSFARYHLPQKKARAIAVFAPEADYTVMVACYDGSFYRLTFDPVKGGEMKAEFVAKF